MTTEQKDRDELVERLADIEHQRWADWQEWVHKTLRDVHDPSPEYADILERWDRQIETPYQELTEREKQSDREQVMRYLPLIEAHYATKIKEAEIRARVESLMQAHRCSGLHDYDNETDEFIDEMIGVLEAQLSQSGGTK